MAVISSRKRYDSLIEIVEGGSHGERQFFSSFFSTFLKKLIRSKFPLETSSQGVLISIACIH